MYAYASRGLLRRHRQADGSSRFDPADLERLAARGRRVKASHEPWSIESAVTSLQHPVPCYRGHPVDRLARTRTFEEVAMLLWTGAMADDSPWQPHPEISAAATLVQEALPDEASAYDRLRVAVATIATCCQRPSESREDIVRIGRGLIAGMVEALPPASGGARRSDDLAQGTLAARLWTRLSPLPLDERGERLLNAALIICADHELTPSTLAARLAAGIGADPYSVVLTALGVTVDTTHHPSLSEAERLIAHLPAPVLVDSHFAALGDRKGPVAGFGHELYPQGDPRAAILLTELQRAQPSAERMDRITALLSAAASAGLPPPNGFLALAAVTHCFSMQTGSASVIRAIARTAGWLAHALEEYASSSVRRQRAVYVGAPPTS